MDQTIEPKQMSSKHVSRLKLAGVLLTLFGIGLFIYLVYSVGINEIFDGIKRLGFAGFGVIVAIYFVRVSARAWAWKLSVNEPYSLRIRDTLPAVIIGEAMSSTIPLGILISGTSKAVAVRKQIPMVAGLSSVATENLFYSLITAVFLILGGLVLLLGFTFDIILIISIGVVVLILTICVVLGILMVIREWHYASGSCEWLYRKGVFTKLLEHGRQDVRQFEDLIYGFYRRYPQRFIPICLLEIIYYVGGVTEVWFILSRIGDAYPSVVNAFLLESVSRLIIVLFKLVPMVIGVDEAGAQFIADTLSLAAGVGVTLAIIRKGRVLFWSAIGLILLIKRGLSIREISENVEAVSAKRSAEA